MSCIVELFPNELELRRSIDNMVEKYLLDQGLVSVALVL